MTMDATDIARLRALCESVSPQAISDRGSDCVPWDQAVEVLPVLLDEVDRLQLEAREARVLADAGAEVISRLEARVADQDALLEGAHREIEMCRVERREDLGKIIALTNRLAVAVEALENMPRLTLAALQGRCDAALAKIRGGA